MKNKFSVAAALAFVVSLLVSMGPLMAAPDGSQRLRGLEGRTFEVEVQNLTTGQPDGQNCYIFLANGLWVDPKFGLGMAVQHSNGASTSYTAEASLDIPNVLSLVLVQEGAVTPAQGKGVLQLEAITRVTGILFGQEFDQEFHSVGFQNDECVLPSD